MSKTRYIETFKHGKYPPEVDHIESYEISEKELAEDLEKDVIIILRTRLNTLMSITNLQDSLRILIDRLIDKGFLP